MPPMAPRNPSALPATTRTSPPGSRPPPWWPPCSSAAPCWPCAATRTPASQPNLRRPTPGSAFLPHRQAPPRRPTTRTPPSPTPPRRWDAYPARPPPNQSPAPTPPRPGCVSPAATSANTCVLNLGRSMVVTAVSITPGWVGADASGADQWHQHRVLTRVQWSFNDTPPTVVPQETGSVHGEATKPMPDQRRAGLPHHHARPRNRPRTRRHHPHHQPGPRRWRWAHRRGPGPTGSTRRAGADQQHPRAARAARRPTPHRPRRQHLCGVVDQDLRPPTPVRRFPPPC